MPHGRLKPGSPLAWAPLWTALMSGCAADDSRIEADMTEASMEITSIDLRTIAARREELDDHWVEFDAYVFLWRGEDFLIAVPGEEVTGPDGNRRTLCRGTDETNLPVRVAEGFGPLGRRDVEDANRQPRVRIRAIFRNAEFSAPNHLVARSWRGYFDEARIVAVTGEYCDLH